MTSISLADGLSIAILLPACNDAPTIGGVVRGFAEALPGARIFVFDNNSRDDTARAASLAGARVFRESRQGRGNVVRRMFADIEADIYLMAAADGSCDPADAPSLVNALVTEHVDMVVGTVRSDRRPGPVERLIRRVLGGAAGMSSSYRAATRRFVKSFPALPVGLDVAAEMSVHAAQLMIPVAEIELGGTPAAPPRSGLPASGTPESGAAPGPRMAIALLKEARPLAFWLTMAMLAWVAGLALAAPSLADGIAAGGAGGAALAATALFVIGFVLAACGLVLDGIARARVEQKRILFLAVPALGVQ